MDSGGCALRLWHTQCFVVLVHLCLRLRGLFVCITSGCAHPCLLLLVHRCLGHLPKMVVCSQTTSIADDTSCILLSCVPHCKRFARSLRARRQSGPPCQFTVVSEAGNVLRVVSVLVAPAQSQVESEAVSTCCALVYGGLPTLSEGFDAVCVLVRS
jgi:hypothetical protein